MKPFTVKPGGESIAFILRRESEKNGGKKYRNALNLRIISGKSENGSREIKTYRR
jgi:hypothetical protein